LSGRLSSSPLCIRTYTLTHYFLLSQLPVETLKRRTNTQRPEAIKMLNLIGKRAGCERTLAKNGSTSSQRRRGARKNSVRVAETAARQLISNFIEFVSPSCVCSRIYSNNGKCVFFYQAKDVEEPYIDVSCSLRLLGSFNFGVRFKAAVKKCISRKAKQSRMQRTPTRNFIW
jgi:hypothetical protein